MSHAAASDASSITRPSTVRKNMGHLRVAHCCSCGYALRLRFVTVLVELVQALDVGNALDVVGVDVGAIRRYHVAIGGSALARTAAVGIAIHVGVAHIRARGVVGEALLDIATAGAIEAEAVDLRGK